MRLAMKQYLFVSVLFAAWAAFSLATEVGAAELKPNPPRFRNVTVLFSAETSKEDRDAFLDGLEEAKLRHQEDYREIVRKWRESAPAKPESKEQTEAEKALEKKIGLPYASSHDFERAFYHNPFFLDLVNVQMIPTDYGKAFFSGEPGTADAASQEDLVPFMLLRNHAEEADALIVVASDGLSSVVNRMIRYGNFGSRRDDMVILFAGVSSFDESIREPRKDGNATGPAVFPNAFAILHPVDPWLNTDLALSVVPKTKKVVLLIPGKIWNEEQETAYRAKLGPGKSLKTLLIPEVPKEDVTEADIAEMKNQFLSSLKAEIQPDTVIVSLSSVEHGQDPVEWLPDDFNACPVFSDTPPVRKNEVGGFCRSMNNLALQAADLLEDLSKDSLYLSRKSVPVTIPENDDLWLNEAAQKHYRLDRLDVFQENVIVANTSTKKAPQRSGYPTWTKKRIFALLAANSAVLFGLTAITLLSIRARRRRRVLSEKVYESMPVRVLVTDREGRIIDYHMQYGEVEQKGELLWKNINEVPWLRDAGIDKAVREAFDSGKTIVREFDIDGERRVVVLSSTPSDVFGRAAVVAVSSDSPQHV